VAKRKQHSTEVAFQDGIIAIESNLPLPYVYYPGHYGAFLGFSENENSQIYFCSCSQTAISNYISFKIRYGERLNADPERNFILSKAKFPQSIIKTILLQNKDLGVEIIHDVKDLIIQYKNSADEIISRLNFKDEICHECNKQTPKYNYCVPMYGGVFEQNYGWYINKQSFEYGVMPVSFKILEEICPDEVFSLLEISKKEYIERYNQLSETDLIIANANDSDFQKITRKIRNVIENEVRVKFGFKKVGEAWANETLLYQLVCEIYPDYRIIRHHRPEFLNFLELDVFIPKLNLAFEYQGIQHFEPIEHWGGKKSLEQGKLRDRTKKTLCEQNNIKLIYIYYYEEISKKLLEDKINSIFSNT
jgi:hypothetical protein